MDLYEALGVRRGASVAEIRRAYQKSARKLHPDLNPGDPVAAEHFLAISRAFEILSDPHRRADYDRHGTVASAAPQAPDVGFEGFDFSVEASVKAVNLRDLFGGGEAKEARPRGEDLEHSARITFEESLKGTKRRVHLVRQDECPVCRGSGGIAFAPVPCPTCGGSGRIRASRGHMIFTRRCAECSATGVLQRKPCPRCSGEGRVMQSEWLDVTIPPGVSDGSRVRVPGCGNAGRQGAPAGDFVLVIEIEPHPYYRREGEDLHCLVPVTLTEAALGAHIEVPTPEGSMTIEIPAGTQAGQRFRLRKRGVPRLGESGRGDLFVEVTVVVPRPEDERSREILREFARLNPQDPRKPLLGKP